MNKLKVLLLQSVVGFILLYVWLRFVDLNNFLLYISDISPIYVLLAIISYISALSLRAVRWRILFLKIKEFPLSLSLLIAFAVTLIGFVVPIRSGEIVAAWLVKSKSEVRYSVAFSTIAITRLFDFLAMTSAMLLILFFVFSDIDAGLLVGFGTVIFLIIFFGLIFAVWKGKALIFILEKIFRFLPKNLIFQKLLAFSKGFIEGFSILRGDFRLLSLLTFYSYLAILLDGLVFYFLFLAFGAPIKLLSAIAGMVLTAYFYLLPSAPGHIGTTEFAGLVVFGGLLNLDADLVGSLFVFAHALLGVVLFVLGAISIILLEVSLGKLLKKLLS